MAQENQNKDVRQNGERSPSLGALVWRPVAAVGERGLGAVSHTGQVMWLVFDAARWIWRALTTKRVRLGRAALISQIMRVGVRSIFIVSLVSGSVGFILALQMAPPLKEFGQKEMVANIVAVAVVRELGPLIAAIVLTGFAGAAIAAEIGTMVVGEEVAALEAHALNPVRFLVVPRVVAAMLCMTALAVLADMVAVGSAMLLSMTALDIPYAVYWDHTVTELTQVDFITGVSKASIFGLLIGAISCANGLGVSGGAAGVGKATTDTVVQSIVAIILADLVFTAIFYAVGLV